MNRPAESRWPERLAADVAWRDGRRSIGLRTIPKFEHGGIEVVMPPMTIVLRGSVTPSPIVSPGGGGGFDVLPERRIVEWTFARLLDGAGWAATTSGSSARAGRWIRLGTIPRIGRRGECVAQAPRTVPQ